MKQAAPRSGEWVIVCDGRKALILENAGDFTSTPTRLRANRAPIRPGAPTRLWERPAARWNR